VRAFPHMLPGCMCIRRPDKKGRCDRVALILLIRGRRQEERVRLSRMPREATRMVRGSLRVQRASGESVLARTRKSAAMRDSRFAVFLCPLIRCDEGRRGSVVSVASEPADGHAWKASGAPPMRPPLGLVRGLRKGWQTRQAESVDWLLCVSSARCEPKGYPWTAASRISPLNLLSSWTGELVSPTAGVPISLGLLPRYRGVFF